MRASLPRWFGRLRRFSGNSVTDAQETALTRTPPKFAIRKKQIRGILSPLSSCIQNAGGSGVADSDWYSCIYRDGRRGNSSRPASRGTRASACACRGREGSDWQGSLRQGAGRRAVLILKVPLSGPVPVVGRGPGLALSLSPTRGSSARTLSSRMFFQRRGLGATAHPTAEWIARQLTE